MTAELFDLVWLLVEATQQAMKEGAMYTVLGGLVAAMASPLLALGATNVIDSKWGMALNRCITTLTMLYILVNANQKSHLLNVHNPH